MSYFERLRMLSRERNTLLCVGLDPDPERIEGGAAGALRHCRGIVRQTEEHACCFKPNSAFWEQYGPDGWQALMELRDAAPTTPFLFDAKRGDMGNTMRTYALAAFKTLRMDAATVNPYLGGDSIDRLAHVHERHRAHIAVRQIDSNRPPDAAGGTGDHCNLSLKFHAVS